jgi:hypothetical protein
MNDGLKPEYRQAIIDVLSAYPRVEKWCQERMALS